MVYKFFRLLANIAIRVFYGKIEVSGIENIPKNVPLLIASNHPNGFLEPIIMACLFPRPLHFMVRGDVFRKKWLKPILVSTNQIPIFRFKDGFSQLRKNDSNLREAYNALDKGAAIILFIEGGTINIKELRPFQKGLARMAYNYLERDDSRKDLHILPVAINFVSPFVLRSRVMLNIDKAYLASSYFEEDTPMPGQIKKLTEDLYDKISPMAFHVSDDNRQDILNKTLKYVEGLLPLPFYPIVNYKQSHWNSLKNVSNSIDAMSQNEFSKFADDIKELEDINPKYVQRLSAKSILRYLLSILLFIPAMIGLIWNIIPGIFAQQLARKVLDEENTVFKASIILSSGVGFYVFYYLICILLLAICCGVKSLLFFLGWPLGFIYLYWENSIRSTFFRKKYVLSHQSRQKLLTILNEHKISYPKFD